MTKPRFDADSPEAREFMTRGNGRPDPMVAMREIKAALENPDGRRQQTEDETDGNVRALKSVARLDAVDRPPQLPMVQDHMSASVAAPEEPRKVGRPLLGKKPKVEKTITLDDDMHRWLIRLSNKEGLRLDAKFSVSGIVDHLLKYALSHVEDDKVLPGPDGYGLEIRMAEETQK